MSCEGATNTARFSSSGMSINNSGYNLKINDVLYRDFDWDSSGEISYLQHVINNLVPANTLELIALSSEETPFPTDWLLRSKSNENLRILLGPWISSSDFEVHAENENPTIFSQQPEYYEFCLSPEQF